MNDEQSTIPVVDIIAREYAFEAPAEVSSGWSTIRLCNEGEELHTLVLYRLPDDITFERVTTSIRLPLKPPGPN